MKAVLPIPFRLALIAGVVAGCGSSTPSGVNFHSATDHYTVSQVKEAFAAQGIRLHQEVSKDFPGFVLLRSGRKPEQLVSTLVEVSHRPSGARFIFGSISSHSGYRLQSRGNVTVSFGPSNAQPVKTALARLH